MPFVKYTRRPKKGDRVLVTARDLKGQPLASWKGHVKIVHNRTHNLYGSDNGHGGWMADVTALLYYGDMGPYSDASYRPRGSYRVPFAWLKVWEDD